VKGYEFGLENGQPAFLKSWSEEEEFRIGDFMEILFTIAPGRTASRLCTGVRHWRDGPFTGPVATRGRHRWYERAVVHVAWIKAS
jgi:hypothetical protein